MGFGMNKKKKGKNNRTSSDPMDKVIQNVEWNYSQLRFNWTK